MISLKNLSKRPLSPDDIRTIAQTLATHSDREAAIVGAAMLESALEDLFRARFVVLTPTEDDAIFAGHGPLSTMSAKIMMAQALNLFSSNVKNDLGTIVKIRNTFAHGQSNFTMDEHAITQACRSLRMKNEADLFIELKRDKSITFSAILTEVEDALEGAPQTIAIFDGIELRMWTDDSLKTKTAFSRTVYYLWLYLHILRSALTQKT